MNYFTTVEQKHSTTKLGEILTCRVVEIYENAVLTRDQALQIPAWLNLQIAENSNGLAAKADIITKR